MARLTGLWGASIVLPRWQAQRVGREYFSSLLELVRKLFGATQRSFRDGMQDAVRSP